MGGMLVRRLALLVPMLLGITFIAFMLGELSPSDPAEVSIRVNAMVPTPELIAQTRHELGLDRPLMTRYFEWLAGVLQGDEHGCIDLSRDMIRGMVIGKRYADARSPRYATIDDVPGWAREETQKLVERGALKGDAHGKLNVSMDMLRTMIVCQRMMDAKEAKA